MYARHFTWFVWSRSSVQNTQPKWANVININIYSKCEVLESDLKQYHLSKNKNHFKIDESQKGFVTARYLTFWVLRLLDAELEFGNGVEALPEMWLYSERVPGLSQDLEQLVIGQEVESGTMTETLNKFYRMTLNVKSRLSSMSLHRILLNSICFVAEHTSLILTETYSTCIKIYTTASFQFVLEED